MVSFEPIGKVVLENGRYFIELNEDVFAAVLGLEEYSHIKLIWWFNLYDSEEVRKYFVMDKPYKKGPEKVGVLATRGPVRPNPIAVTVCQLLSVDNQRRRIEVAYTDAENGTPVLDIKPYHPSEDRVRDAKVPDWCAHWPKNIEESADFDWSGEFNFPD